MKNIIFSCLLFFTLVCMYGCDEDLDKCLYERGYPQEVIDQVVNPEHEASKAYKEGRMEDALKYLEEEADKYVSGNQPYDSPED